MPKFPTHKDDVEFPSLEKVRKAQEKRKAATERQKQHEQRTMLDLMKIQASPQDRITRIPQLEKSLGIEEEPGEGVGRRLAMQQIMEREAEKQEQERKRREMIPSYDLKRRIEEGDMPKIEAYEAPQDRGITERIGDWQKEQPIFSSPTERAKISYEELVPRSTQRSIQDFITKQTTDRGIGWSQLTTGLKPHERGTYYTDEEGEERYMPPHESIPLAEGIRLPFQTPAGATGGRAGIWRAPEMTRGKIGELELPVRAITSIKEARPRFIMQTLEQFGINTSNIVDSRRFGFYEPEGQSPTEIFDRRMETLPEPENMMDAVKNIGTATLNSYVPYALDILIGYGQTKREAAMVLRKTKFDPMMDASMSRLKIPKNKPLTEKELLKKTKESFDRLSKGPAYKYKPGDRAIEFKQVIDDAHYIHKKLFSGMEPRGTKEVLSWRFDPNSLTRPPYTPQGQWVPTREINWVKVGTEPQTMVSGGLEKLQNLSKRILNIQTPRPHGWQYIEGLPGWKGKGGIGLGIEPLKGAKATQAQNLARQGLSADQIAKQLNTSRGVIEATVPALARTVISPELQPLVEEAKKYPSAEEFVEAQPTFYHGTSNIKQIQEKGFVGGWLTDDKNIAKRYGEVIETSVPENLLVDAEKYRGQNFTKTEILKRIGEENPGKWGIIDKGTSKGENLVFPFIGKKPLLKSQLTDIWNKAQRDVAPKYDIQETGPEIKPTTDLGVKDIHGTPQSVDAGEILQTYQLPKNQFLIQGSDKSFVLNKGQYQNLTGHSQIKETKEFAPELGGLTETIRGHGQVKKESDIRWTEEEGKLEGELDGRRFIIEKEPVGDGYYVGELGGLLGHRTRNYTEAVEAINRYLEKEGPTPKYNKDNLVLPGGENYREILIQVPQEIPDRLTYDQIQRKLSDFERYPAGSGEREELRRLQETAPDPEHEAVFQSPHWEEPDVIAHLRLNDRTYQGKPVTFMEEMQSDWAREGRREGFIPDRTPQELTPAEKAELDVLMKDARDISGFYNTPDGIRAAELLEKQSPGSVVGGIPYHPALKNWQELTLKRALKDAVERDADYFAWITGEQTSARYSLATYVDNVNWFDPTTAKTGVRKTIEIKPKEGSKRLEFEIDNNGVIKSVEDASIVEWKGKKLDEVLGKGLADKIMEKESGTLSGEGLKFGGEWAENLYDKQVPNILKQLTGENVVELDMGLPALGDESAKQQAIQITENVKAKVRGEEAFGAVAGIEMEEDEEGYIDLSFNPLLAVLGVAGMRMVGPGKMPGRGIQNKIIRSAQRGVPMDRISTQLGIGREVVRNVLREQAPQLLPPEETAIDPTRMAIDQAEGEVWMELDVAEAGKRLAIPSQEIGVDYEFIAQRSTFPEWIPPELRTTPLVKSVMKNMEEGTVPGRGKARELYDVVQGEIAERAGVPVEQIVNVPIELTEQVKQDIRPTVEQILKEATVSPPSRSVKDIIKQQTQRPPAPFVRKRETTLLKERVRNIARGVREGTINTKTEIKNVQSELKDVIKKSGLTAHDQKKFIDKIVQIQNRSQLEKAWPEISNRISRLFEAQEVRALRAEIDKQLKDIKPVRDASGVLRSKFTPEQQAKLDNIREATNMKMKDADKEIERISSELMYQEDIPLDIGEQIRLLRYANRDMDSSELRELLDDIISIKKDGKTLAETRKINKEAEIQRKVDVIVPAIWGDLERVIGTFPRRDPSFDDVFLGKARRMSDDYINMILDFEFHADKLTNARQYEVLEGPFVDHAKQHRRNLGKLLEGQFIGYEALNEGIARTLGKSADPKIVGQFKGSPEKEKDMKIKHGLIRLQETRDLGNFKDDFQENVQLKLSVDELISVNNWLKNAEVERVFRDVMGFNDPMINAIKGALKPEEEEYANFLINEFYPQYFEGYDGISLREVYGRRFDTAFNPRPDYTPLARDVDKPVYLEQLNDYIQNISTKPGAIKARIANNNPIKIRGATEIATKYITDMERFKHMSEYIDETRKIFHNKEFRDAILRTQYDGQKHLDLLNDTIERIWRGQRKFEDRVLWLDTLKGYAYSGLLGINPTQIPKQLTSGVSSLYRVPAKEWKAGFNEYVKSPKEITNFLREHSPLLRARYRKMNFSQELAQAKKEGWVEELTKDPGFRNKIMFMTKYGDMGGIAVAGWPVYRYEYNQAISRGLSKEEAHNKAIAEFEDNFSKTQTSPHMGDIGSLQAGGSWGATWTLFNNATMQYNRFALAAFRNMKKGKGSWRKNARTAFIFWSLLPVLFGLATHPQDIINLFNRDERGRRARRRIALNATAGGTQYFVIVGSSLYNIGRGIVGLNPFRGEVSPTSLNILGEIERETISMVDTIKDIAETGDFGPEDLIEAIQAFEKAATLATGLPIANVAELSRNHYQAIFGDLDNYLKLFGYSDWATDSDIKKPKIRAPKGSGPIPGLETEVEFPGAREVDRPGFEEDVKFPGYKH